MEWTITLIKGATYSIASHIIEKATAAKTPTPPSERRFPKIKRRLGHPLMLPRLRQLYPHNVHGREIDIYDHCAARTALRGPSTVTSPATDRSLGQKSRPRQRAEAVCAGSAVHPPPDGPVVDATASSGLVVLSIARETASGTEFTAI